MLLFGGEVSKQWPDHGPSTPCNDSGLGTMSACCAAYISVVFVSQCTRDDFDHGTECLLLAMKYSGVHAKILDGNPDLWKVLI